MKSKLIEAHKEIEPQVFNKSLGVYFNGEDNLYPDLVENLIDASPTAQQCAWLYESFLGGGGFVLDFRRIDLRPEHPFRYTPDDLLLDVAESMSRHQGVFLHINYNALFEKTSIEVVPFTQCRIGKKDDNEYYGKILVSKKGWGQELKKEKIQAIDVFNPDPVVVQAQVDAAGGWENYKGQIVFFSLQPKRLYPKSLIDGVYLFADTEYRIGHFFNSTTRRGFINIKVVRHKPMEDQDRNQLEKNLGEIMGTENASSLMMVEDDWNSDDSSGNLKIDEIASDEKADRFTHFEEASANYIRKAFKNIPPQLVDYVQGKLGSTSGEDLLKAQAMYNALIARDRMRLESLFETIFANFVQPVNPTGDWAIKQYKLLDDGTVNQ